MGTHISTCAWSLPKGSLSSGHGLLFSVPQQEIHLITRCNAQPRWPWLRVLKERLTSLGGSRSRIRLPIYCVWHAQVTVDATNAQSILGALARNASSRGFSALAESIVVALAEGRGRAVSDAVGAAVGAEAGSNSSQVCTVPHSLKYGVYDPGGAALDVTKKILYSPSSVNIQHALYQ